MAKMTSHEGETFKEWLGRKVHQGLAEIGNYYRQGLRELRNLIYPESPHAAQPDAGMWGNRLPQEIYNDRHGTDRHGVHGKAGAKADSIAPASPAAAAPTLQASSAEPSQALTDGKLVSAEAKSLSSEPAQLTSIQSEFDKAHAPDRQMTHDTPEMEME